MMVRRARRRTLQTHHIDDRSDKAHVECPPVTVILRRTQECGVAIASRSQGRLGVQAGLLGGADERQERVAQPRGVGRLGPGVRDGEVMVPGPYERLCHRQRRLRTRDPLGHRRPALLRALDLLPVRLHLGGR